MGYGLFTTLFQYRAIIEENELKEVTKNSLV